jgi:cation diffusion facilitator CzcD-associated flavoprotein CzcO
VQASHWTDRRIPLAGRQIAVIGTGSSGVQITPVVAEQANNLYVFQRTANFSVPARNGPLDNARIDAMAADVPGRRAHLLATRAGNTMGLVPVLPYANFTPEERRARLEQQWALGGQGMNRVFADQGIDAGVNRIVADFVRAKIREIVKDPDVAEQLCPYDHPIGTRRLCMDTGYYETFNRDNVTLVNVARDPIDRITPRGIKTRSAHYEVDLIIFALGFHAFRGAMDRIDIRNQHGVHPTDRWSLGPRTLLGLMTAGFPNLFFLTGPGSPSVLANLVLMNEVHVDFVASLISHMARHGHDTVEPELAAEDGWVERVAAAASKLLRLGVSNYMVQVNPDDGSRVFMPYVAGLDVFSRTCDDIVERGFPGFVFGSAGGRQAASARHREAVR